MDLPFPIMTTELVIWWTKEYSMSCNNIFITLNEACISLNYLSYKSAAIFPAQYSISHLFDFCFQ